MFDFKFRGIIFFIVLFQISSSFSQVSVSVDSSREDGNAGKVTAGAGESVEKPVPEDDVSDGVEYLPVPDTYRGIRLGMGLDEVKEILKTEPVFGYRGERDVSMIPNPDRTLIETSGSGYIKNAWFQFSEDSLYIMTIVLNTEKIDYYSMYKSLSEKYGEPENLSPQKAMWLSDTVCLTLEKPLYVKYIDTEIYNNLLDTSRAGVDYEELLQEAFIDSF